MKSLVHDVHIYPYSYAVATVWGFVGFLLIISYIKWHFIRLSCVYVIQTDDEKDDPNLRYAGRWHMENVPRWLKYTASYHGGRWVCAIFRPGIYPERDPLFRFTSNCFVYAIWITVLLFFTWGFISIPVTHCVDWLRWGLNWYVFNNPHVDIVIPVYGDITASGSCYVDFLGPYEAHLIQENAFQYRFTLHLQSLSLQERPHIDLEEAIKYVKQGIPRSRKSLVTFFFADYNGGTYMTVDYEVAQLIIDILQKK